MFSHFEDPENRIRDLDFLFVVLSCFQSIQGPSNTQVRGLYNEVVEIRYVLTRNLMRLRWKQHIERLFQNATVLWIKLSE